MSQTRNRKRLPAFQFRYLIPIYLCIITLFAILIRRGNMQLLEPHGYIADFQSKILWAFIGFDLFVAACIIIAFYIVVFRYQDDKKRQYEPKRVTSVIAQTVGWGAQFLAIVVISIMVWTTAHQIDPYKPIASHTKALTVEVVALQWKWLFLYPEQHVATVNMLEIPANTPISLQLTADAPMNSFWVPQLSGQIYAMTGMVNQLHIEADKPGVYPGSPAEISGADFAGMTFNVNAVTPQDFAAWVTSAQHAPKALDYNAYTTLAKPSGYVHPATYTLPYTNLFDAIVMKFMAPVSESPLPQKGN